MTVFNEYTAKDYSARRKTWTGDPDVFEVFWMISRIAYWCGCISARISIGLNECGWMFNPGSPEEGMFDRKQALEKLERLLVTQKCRIMEDGMTPETFRKCHGLAWGFTAIPEPKEFLSGQEYGNMMKIYRKYIKKLDKYGLDKRFD